MFYKHPVYKDYLAYRHNGRVVFICLLGQLPRDWEGYVWFVYGRQAYSQMRCSEAENIRYLRQQGWQLV